MRIIASLLILAAAAPAFAQSAPVDIAAARAALTGTWSGKLEYLDYGANKWFGIPVKTQIEDQGDGVTIIFKRNGDAVSGLMISTGRARKVPFAQVP